MKTEQQRDLEKSLRAYLADLFERRLEYEDAQTDKVINDEGKNTQYFKGKADAYAYAHNQLVGILQWFDIKL